MELPDVLQNKSRAELEEWFIESLSTEPMPVREMLLVIRCLGENGDRMTAREWGELMQDALMGPDRADDALRLLALRLDLQEEGAAGFRGECRAAAGAVMEDRLGRAMVDSVGFEREDMPLKECLRRLELLRALKEGVLCLDKTWGFGVVRELDDFYKKVTIDFDSRRGHQMTFAYAGETLQLLSDNHLMARRFRDPEHLAQMVQTAPGEVVRIAVRSYGAMSAPDVQALLVPDLVAEADWKRFWSAARKDLKADPLVDLPAKRTQPIRLLAAEKEYGDAWFAALRAERDMQRILELIKEWEGQGGKVSALSEEQRGALSDRLAFCIHGNQWGHPERVARLLLRALNYGFRRMPEGDAEQVAWRIDAEEACRQMVRPDRLLSCMSRLPIREAGQWLDHLVTLDGEATCRVLLEAIDELPPATLPTVIDVLVREGHQEACAARLHTLFREREAGPALALWACSNLDRVAAWHVADLPNLLATTVELMGGEYGGQALKANNELERLFANLDWLQEVFARIDAATRSNLLKRIQGIRGIDIVQRRSIMARVIKMYPELEHELEPDEEASATSKKGRYTSWRSYNKRREDLRRLVEELIPANSRDIAVARSYGDLSENHEYKTAKEHQGILMRRRQEWERDLAEVQGSDFAEFPVDGAGIGTRVEIQRPDGTMQCYRILGEWDGDPELGIISSQSKLAKVLEGHQAGEEVRLPVREVVSGFDADEPCVITSVSGLDEAAREYLDTVQASG